jgi:lysophospholipase L1-like esterase
MRRRAFLLLPLAALPFYALAQMTAPVLVGLGDSITGGMGASAYARCYAMLLASALGYTLDNRAIGGSTIATQHASVQATTTTPVVWLTGFNDAHTAHTDLDIYTAALADATAWLTQADRALYLGNCLRKPGGDDVLVAAYNARIASVVQAARQDGRRVIPVDASAAYDPATMCGPDGAHPNDAGHAAIADAFLATMQRRVLLPIVRQAAYPAP